jgi:hypothetical protein
MFASLGTGDDTPSARTEHPVLGGLQVQPTPGCRLLAGREFGPANRTRNSELAFAELEALAGTLLPVLFAFLHA